MNHIIKAEIATNEATKISAFQLKNIKYSKTSILKTKMKIGLLHKEYKDLQIEELHNKLCIEH